MNSLRRRLLLASVVVLALFVLVTGFALQRANQQSALQAQQERMQGLVYALLGAVEINRENFRLNESEVPEPRLGTPGSGLVAIATDDRGRVVWQSTSSLGGDVSLLSLEAGEWRFIDNSDSNGLFFIAFGFRWLTQAGAQRYTLLVSESANTFLQNRETFRQQLWLWLLVPAAVLLVVQLLMLGWTMHPLQRLAKEIGEVEAGADDRIDGDYPDELSGLQNALNMLLRQEGERQRRYRQSLDDLAHSLKTPLSVITGIVASRSFRSGENEEIAEQASHMEQIISRQLKRAALKSRPLLLPPVIVEPVADAVLRSLQKVYRDKKLEFDSEINRTCAARIDETDLFDLLGNLLDNACKWAASRVFMRIACTDGETCIRIEDDGPGFPEDARQLLERGIREDSSRPGQGLGLAFCVEIVRSAGGELEIAPDGMGRSAVLVRLRT